MFQSVWGSILHASIFSNRKTSPSFCIFWHLWVSNLCLMIVNTSYSLHNQTFSRVVSLLFIVSSKSHLTPTVRGLNTWHYSLKPICLDHAFTKTTSENYSIGLISCQPHPTVKLSALDQIIWQLLLWKPRSSHLITHQIILSIIFSYYSIASAQWNEDDNYSNTSVTHQVLRARFRYWRDYFGKNIICVIPCKTIFWKLVKIHSIG